MESAVLATSADGTPIYTSAIGNPRAASIVFIHGFSIGAAVFDEIFHDPRWHESLYLVRYDLRGHARSGMPTEPEFWASSRLAEDFDAVVRAFGLTRPFVLGWSIGGTQITDILSFFPPSYLSGVIHLCAIPFMSAIPSAAQDLSTSVLPPSGQSHDVVAYQAAAWKFTKGCSKRASYSLYLSCLSHIMVQPPAITQYVLNRTQDEHGLIRAGQQGLPYLTICGDQDEIVDAATASRVMDSFVNKRHIVLRGADHIPWISHSEEMRQEIFRFVDDVLSQRPIS
ncbi:alpha/beta-hydrolase [Cylindrobasidium torrendii FP15055 ss-10]|uniref:Alpha/beta-hydrolase n=1 Tax=Cylindrobasidium torrendii FP15055 ss-10 TaxID=1314674 RepID=A0A0D7B6Y6_9AGAR|nr:alpha/beta-hydrolase [Cylindrobasidium torrendii FP15055 ss-10]